MQSIVRHLALKCSILLIASCATIQINSSKDSNYSDQIRKLYIIVDVADLKVAIWPAAETTRGTQGKRSKATIVKMDLGEYLKNKLKEALASLDIETDSAWINGLELDSFKIDQAIEAFGARSTLTIKRTGTAVGAALSRGQNSMMLVKIPNQGEEMHLDLLNGTMPTYTASYMHTASAPPSVTNIFDISLDDLAMKKTIWRAKLKVKSYHGYSNTDADHMIENLIKALRKDRLIK
jgi:hypothetical protein